MSKEIYAAALSPDDLSSWVWQATELLGGCNGNFYVVDHNLQFIHMTILHKNMQLVERYISEEIYRLDPQAAYSATLPRGSVYTDVDFIAPNNPQTREYLAWHSANGGLRHFMTATAKPGNIGHIGAFSVNWSADHGPPPAHARSVMETLRPDIERALELSLKHTGKLEQAFWEGATALSSEPCALLNAQGTVLIATPAMEQIWANPDGYVCQRGRLQAHIGPGMLDFSEVLARLIAHPDKGGGTWQIQRPSGRASYIAKLYPLPERTHATLFGHPAALLSIVDPATLSPATPRWVECFALTRAESGLASLLMQGHSVETAAQAASIALGTARVHLRNLFQKTGTSRQAELIRLLSRI